MSSIFNLKIVKTISTIYIKGNSRNSFLEILILPSAAINERLIMVNRSLKNGQTKKPLGVKIDEF